MDKIRIDKWLWHARFFKTRTLAGKQSAGGKIRINDTPIHKASHMVKVGDILTFPTGSGKNAIVRVIEIVALGQRRESAPKAQLLYNDLAPPQPRLKAPEDDFHHRDKGTGRPTKKQRRETDYLHDDFGAVLRDDHP